MNRIPAMINMARTPAEKKEAMETLLPSVANQSDYPYGLCISLCQDELEKLGFEQGELQVSDMVHLHCMATVTSMSTNDSEVMGPSSRVELQITHIAAEDEDTEDERPVSRLYK